MHVNGMYLDGSKDAKQIMKNKEDKLYRKTIVAKHYVVVGKPENNI